MRLVGASAVTHDRIRIEHRSWSFESEVNDLASFDVGLMPLPDDPWTRGKGGYKLLQYGAMGLPVVASPVGVNTEIVEEGVTGFLADSEDRWVESLLRLVDDAELRSRMGNAGRDRIVERYSLDQSSRRLIGILKTNR
jgi:glycosyltransferase involved in cell wall biosynthesis